MYIEQAPIANPPPLQLTVVCKSKVDTSPASATDHSCTIPLLRHVCRGEPNTLDRLYPIIASVEHTAPHTVCNYVHRDVCTTYCTRYVLYN